MAHNYSYYKSGIEKLFYIVNKEMQPIPFTLNPPQNRILKELDGGNRDIILKARKEGVSSLILAMFLLDFLTVENIKCVVISHEDESTRRLFDRAKYYLESMKTTWPKGQELPFSLKYNSKKEMVNTKMNSTFYIGTAGSRAFGRGDDIHNLHVSELAFWPDPEGMMLGISNSVTPSGRIIIETTANGIGDYFYKMWVKAREGNSPYRHHFIPWFEDPTNVMPVTYQMELTQEEQNLINTYRLSREQIAWRRWKINEDAGGDWQDPASWDKFNQENPATADESFIVSGNPVWSPMLLKFYLTRVKRPVLVGNTQGYDPISIEPNEKGYLKVYKEPNEFHTYAIGVDVSEGKIVDSGRERDASCAQVFDKTTYEQVAVWHGRIDPDKLGYELDRLGRYYNDALIGVERNAVGVTPLVVLRDLNYPNLYYREKLGYDVDKVTTELGWVTDAVSKESLIADATQLLREKRIAIYDESTVSELMSFVRDSEGKAKAAKSAFDDRVMAFLIGLRMLQKAKHQSSVNEIEQSDYNTEGFYYGGQSFNSQGMPVHPDEMDNSPLYSGDEF